MSYIYFGHGDRLFEVPYSKGLYLGTHEGCMYLYYEPVKMIFSNGESNNNCPQAAANIAKRVTGGIYLCDELIIYTFLKAKSYEGQPMTLKERYLCGTEEECYSEQCDIYSIDGVGHYPFDVPIEEKLSTGWWDTDDLFSFLPPISLKEFDPRYANYNISIKSKIKNIGNPTYNQKYHRWEQKITLYDDNSKKTIKSLVVGKYNVFYEDEFESGDTVQVFGNYYVTHKLPFQIYEIIKIKKSDKKQPLSRNNNSWVNSVKERDKVCQCCGDMNHLEAHHIFSYALHEQLRDTVENGIALCKWCHSKYHSHYGKKEGVNPTTLNEFLRNFGRNNNG